MVVWLSVADAPASAPLGSGMRMHAEMDADSTQGAHMHLLGWLFLQIELDFAHVVARLLAAATAHGTPWGSPPLW